VDNRDADSVTKNERGVFSFSRWFAILESFSSRHDISVGRPITTGAIIIDENNIQNKSSFCLRNNRSLGVCCAVKVGRDNCVIRVVRTNRCRHGDVPPFLCTFALLRRQSER